jgi:site-specific DNA recombinase
VERKRLQGKTTYVHYYHCNSKCGLRYNAKLVNEKFIELLKNYKLNPAVIDLYETLITQTYEIETGNGKAEVVLYKKQLTDLIIKSILLVNYC